MTEAFKLGASLYVPAIRRDLVDIANGVKYPRLRSVIFCTEDALAQRDLPLALSHLGRCLPRFSDTAILRFIRARNPEVLGYLLQLDGIERVDGFVVPKLTQYNMDGYFSPLLDTGFKVMATLETREALDHAEMSALRHKLLAPEHRDRVLALRIGGNDLLRLLGIRRPRDRTLYATPIGSAIANLVLWFKPYGFNLTAPVFEYLDRDGLLRDEIQQDLAYGLFGKTAIHPEQIPIIESFYGVKPDELDMAAALLNPESRPVFRSHNAMCEVATHLQWARDMLTRAEIYGVAS
ncbi:MAG: HpcH/HpaI aldolase/citrate lyase family protein [Beggiatoa sp.]|nr:HpcH/HpaI aldolase/citrate lyase family protein [Beggiatoa sp.]